MGIIQNMGIATHGYETEEGRSRLAREKEFLYWLNRCPGFGPITVRTIWEQAGSFEAVYNIEGMELVKKGVLRREKQGQVLEDWKKQLEPMRQEYYKLCEKGIRYVTPLDAEYPDKLRNIYDYPMGLYVKGELPKDEYPSAAVIGARNCTVYGRQTAEYMAGVLAKQGIQIISGLALGIDGAGHEGAVKADGRTFAVLGCGVNICYPRTNYRLFEKILERGGILSEYAPDEEPNARNFPARNRIISGLSDVILVMEARQKSGSLITAQLGLDQGREIFALPGRITDPLSEGCNGLIKAGAGMLTSPGDVLEYMGIFYEKQMISCKKTDKGLANFEKMVYSCLDSEPRHPEQIAMRTGLPIGRCIGALSELELGGYAMRVNGQYYVRRITQEQTL